jgi:hypothetical protein
MSSERKVDDYFFPELLVNISLTEQEWGEGTEL